MQKYAQKVNTSHERYDPRCFWEVEIEITSIETGAAESESACYKLTAIWWEVLNR